MTQSNTIKIAITGGIGSGKSAVCQFIKEQGLPVFSCDEIYSQLLKLPAFIEKIAAEFDGVINSDGSLNRKALAEKVFNDEVSLKKLNAITHPEILQAAFNKMEKYRLSFLEVPLLFENGFEKLFDGVIVVCRDRNERINAIMKRDKISQGQAILRLNSQLKYDNCDFSKYYVIHNCSNLVYLKQNTLEILKKIIN